MIRAMSPAAKLAALAIVAVALSIMPGLALPIGALIVLIWMAAGLAWSRLLRALRPLVWILAPVAVFQIWLLGLEAALRTVIAIVVLVAAAELVTATTRLTDFLSAITRLLQPLARFGASPSSIAFAIVFLIRLAPVIGGIGRDIMDARLARGASRNPFPAAAPLLIRTLRFADLTADALDCRK